MLFMMNTRSRRDRSAVRRWLVEVLLRLSKQDCLLADLSRGRCGRGVKRAGVGKSIGFLHKL